MDIEIPFLGLRINSASNGMSSAFIVVLRLYFRSTEDSRTFSSIIANLLLTFIMFRAKKLSEGQTFATYFWPMQFLGPAEKGT